MGHSTSSGRTGGPAPRTIIPPKERERSLVNAIARAKRTIERYGVNDAIEDAAIGYYLRPDEIFTLQNAVADYLEKNGTASGELGLAGSIRRAEAIKELRERVFNI